MCEMGCMTRLATVSIRNVRLAYVWVRYGWLSCDRSENVYLI